MRTDLRLKTENSGCWSFLLIYSLLTTSLRFETSFLGYIFTMTLLFKTSLQFDVVTRDEYTYNSIFPVFSQFFQTDSSSTGNIIFPSRRRHTLADDSSRLYFTFSSRIKNLIDQKLSFGKRTNNYFVYENNNGKRKMPSKVAKWSKSKISPNLLFSHLITIIKQCWKQ